MFNLHDQLIKLENEEPEIENEYDFINTETAKTKRALNSLTDQLVESNRAINDPEVFDVLQSFSRDLRGLDGKVIARGMDAIIAGLESEIQYLSKNIENKAVDTSSHGEILDRYAYILQWVIDGLESETTSNQGNTGLSRTKGRKTAKRAEKNLLVCEIVPGWGSKAVELFSAVRQLFNLRLSRLWGSTPERDSFIEVFIRIANKILENTAYLKNPELQSQLFHILCICVVHYNKVYNIATMVTQSIQHYDHLGEPLAVLLKMCTEQYEVTQLADEVLRGMANKEFSTVHDRSGPKNLASFIISLSEQSPKTMIRHIGVFVHYLDSDSHLMRSAIIEIIGNLIIFLAEQEQTEITRNQIIEYFDILEQRFCDIHFLVRAKVLQVCQRLCSIKAKFPKQRPRLVDLVIKRLHDKTSSVRKHAVRAMIALLETHPFIMDGGELVIEHLEEQSEKINKELEALTKKASQKIRNPEKSQSSPKYKESGDDEDEDEDEDEEQVPEKDKENEEAINEQGEERDSAVGTKDDNVPEFTPEDANRVMELQMRQRYYRDAMYFVRQVQGAIPTLCDLLGSTNKQEVMEGINFFVAAARYRIAGAQQGIRRMSHLIWQPSGNNANEETKGIHAKLIESYYQLYLTPDPRATLQENTNRITKNLITLTFNATLAELTSLEALLKAMMNEGYIADEVIQKLRNVYGYTKKNLPAAQRRGAILVLSMLAKAQPSIVTDDIDFYLKVGLGTYGHEDLLVAKYTCIALQSLVDSPNFISRDVEEIEIKRLPMNNPIFQRLSQILRLSCHDLEWFPAAEQAINSIYSLGDKPSELATSLLKDQFNNVLRAIKEDNPTDSGNGSADSTTIDGTTNNQNNETDGDEMDVENDDEATIKASPKIGSFVDSWELSKLLFMVGHIAIKEIVLIELIESNLKNQKSKRDAEKKNEGISEQDEELNQVAGTTEDDIGEAIASIREREFLHTPSSLLANYAPLVIHVCSSPATYGDQTLQVHAITALAKLMCVSSSFCEQHLPLLLNILKRSNSPVIRSNIAIALGDITVCFSNLMGENVHFLYEPLRDTDLKVKRSMLMVLTHLILNGMIKVKGQLGEMAKCLEDPDPRVADLSKLFFSELSSKDNAIYNNLPDIISSLSTSDGGVSEENFARIMKFLFEFIKDKDRQAENVVEKLCQRFRATTEPRQWRDISYCLSLLPFKSERSVRRLLDGFSCYQETLSDNTVHKNLSDIVVKLRSQSFQKQDTKIIVEELALKITQGRARATGEELADEASGINSEQANLAMAQSYDNMDVYSDDEL
ncbi:condensin complex non-SMC subunit Cnd1 [Mycoemilia scoparia]|uniref:Condensin complex subunit 1 n=1 Tax=Mycoemilia scoparia TaxID=417184 RepID=A0A9W8DXB2_9FUNG|nr:condensin complex non-SMC subunit Cnd1 [Mycoemilia scoparia]